MRGCGLRGHGEGPSRGRRGRSRRNVVTNGSASRAWESMRKEGL